MQQLGDDLRDREVTVAGNVRVHVARRVEPAREDDVPHDRDPQFARSREDGLCDVSSSYARTTTMRGTAISGGL